MPKKYANRPKPLVLPKATLCQTLMDIVKPSEYFCGAESPEMRITGTLKTKFLCERAPEHMDDHGATFGNRPIWWQPVEEPLLEDESDFDAEALSI